MYYRFGKFFYYVSILILIATLLYFYAALPEQIGFSLDDAGNISREWEKGAFFYGMIGAFLVLNLATLYTPKSLETKTNRKLHRIFPIGDPFRDYLLTWFYSFGAWVNLGLALAALFVHSINNQEDIGVASYSLWFALLPIILVVWTFGLFVMLFKKFKSIQQEN